MLTLVTGGSASGKSEFAEDLLRGMARGLSQDFVNGKKPLTYLATMRSDSEEARCRIEKHRKNRAGKGFQTVECPVDLPSRISECSDFVLLECLSNLVANEMFRDGGYFPEIEEKLADDLEKLIGRTKELIIVTNEIFSGDVSDTEETRQYLRVLGNLNCHLARRAERVIEVIYGIPVARKGSL